MAFNRLHVNDLATATLDDSDQVIIGESNTFKKATVSALKNKILGSSPSYTTDTEPYLMRKTAHTGVVGKCALNKLVGGSLGWNQLNNYGQNSGTNNGVTYTKTASGWTVSGTASSSNQSQFRTTTDIPCVSGHRYLCIANAELSTNGLYIIIWRNNSATRAASIGQNAAGRLVMFTGGSDWTNLNIWFHVPAGKTASNTNLVVNLIDLTAEFGSTIADYIYSLESATAGAGVAWLSKYIDLGTYHAYDAGSIQNVQATAHVTTGFNQWDETWEMGEIYASTGEEASSTTTWRTKSYIPVIGGTQYYLHCAGHSGSGSRPRFYDGSKNYIGYTPKTGDAKFGTIFTVPDNCAYMRFCPFVSEIPTGSPITLNISKPTGTPKNGDYVPYNGHSYPLGSDTLRGIPQLVSTKLAFDGDVKTPDGTITRKYGYVDLGSLNWDYDGGSGRFFVSNVINDGMRYAASEKPKALTGIYPVVARQNLTDYTLTMVYSSSTNWILAMDSRYSTAAAFKTAMSGVYLVYPLETPTTESSTSYQKVQTIDADGTESFTTSSPVPVGHETQTPNNILAALSWVGE